MKDKKPMEKNQKRVKNKKAKETLISTYLGLFGAKVSPPRRQLMNKLIPIIGIEGTIFKQSADSYFDIFRIITKDLASTSSDDFEYLVAQWAVFYKKTGFDIKLVSLNVPTDTRRQQKYIEHKISKNNNPDYEDFLIQKLDDLKAIQELRTDREFYLFVFASSIDEMRDSHALIMQSLVNNNLAEEMSIEAKLSVLERMNNKAATQQSKNAETVQLQYPTDKAKVQRTIEKQGFDPWLIHAIQPHGGVAPISEKYLATGVGYEACITISKFPTNVDSCWLSRIMNIDGVTSVIDIATENPNETKKNVNAGIKEQIERINDAKDASAIKTAQRRLDELNTLWEEIDLLGEVLKLLRVRIFVSAETFAECDTAVKEIIQYLETLDYEASIYVNETIPDFKSMYQSYKVQQTDEFAKDYKRYGQPIQSTTLADGIPFHFANLSDPCGTYLGTTTSNNGSVLFDLHTLTDRRNSYNGIIVGLMGSGKSTLLKKLVLDMTVRGNYVRGFDPSGEFKPLIQRLGGAYLSLDGTDGILNALEILRTSDEGENMCLVNHLAKLRTVFTLLAPDASSDTASYFEECMQEFYISYGLINPDVPLDEQHITGLPSNQYPIFSDFIAYLSAKREGMKETGDTVRDALMVREAEHLDTVYRTFKTVVGTYHNLLDGHTSINNVLDRQLVYFNIKNLLNANREIFQVQLFLALNLFWDNCVSVGELMKKRYEAKEIAWEDIIRFQIVIDEASNIINAQNEGAVEQLIRFERNARKYFGGIITATQSLRDHVPEGSSVEGKNKITTFFELATYKFIFRQDSNVLPLMEQVFRHTLTPDNYDEIPTLKKGEMILCMPERNLQMQVEASQSELDLFSGGA